MGSNINNQINRWLGQMYDAIIEDWTFNKETNILNVYVEGDCDSYKVTLNDNGEILEAWTR